MAVFKSVTTLEKYMVALCHSISEGVNFLKTDPYNRLAVSL